MPDYCPQHVNTEIVPDEDTGEPTCQVCTTLALIERVAIRSFEITGPDGETRTVTREEFIEHMLEQA